MKINNSNVDKNELLRDRVEDNGYYHVFFGSHKRVEYDDNGRDQIALQVLAGVDDDKKPYAGQNGCRSTISLWDPKPNKFFEISLKPILALAYALGLTDKKADELIKQHRSGELDIELDFAQALGRSCYVRLKKNNKGYPEIKNAWRLDDKFVEQWPKGHPSTCSQWEMEEPGGGSGSTAAATAGMRSTVPTDEIPF